MFEISKKEKIIAIFAILAGIFYFIGENITLYKANISTFTAYIGYSVSELAVPFGDIYNGAISTLSPLAHLLNFQLIFLGVMVLIINFTLVKKCISKYKYLFYLLTLILGFGYFIVAIFHTGGPNSEGMHRLGAMMLFFGGSFLVLFIGLFADANPTYKKIALILGIIGLIGGVIFCLIKVDPVFSVYRGFFERGNIYSTIIWLIVTGGYLITNKISN